MIILALIVLILGWSFVRHARGRKRLKQAKARQRADAERVLKRLVVLSEDGRRSFYDIKCPPENTKGFTLVHLWPHPGGHVLLKRFKGCDGARYVIDFDGLENGAGYFPPEGTFCDERWFQRPMERLFELFGKPL